jgi:polyisoprenoid-binding protein YceI
MKTSFMKKLNILFVLVAFASTAMAQTTWSLDKAHSKLGFGVSHLVVSEVDGVFTSFDLKITSAKDDFQDAVVELTADAASVNTSQEDRDKHLKNADFFDVEKYPTITFKSKSFKKTSGKNYKIVGDLTLHGVTKEVTLDAIFNGTAVHPYNKKTLAAFKVTGTFKRSDFAFGAGTPAAVVGDEVTLDAKIEAFKN